MAPRVLVQFLGLCNFVAGALLAFAPARVAPLDGLHSPAATLSLRSAAACLVAMALGAWWVPADAQRGYLWIFGVGLKGAGALVWAATAWDTRVGPIWVAAAVDVAIAMVIAGGLVTTRPTR